MGKMEEFIEQIFEFLGEKELTSSTIFKEIAAWNSLNALIIHANIKKKYDVELTNEEIKRTQSIKDLWLMVEAKRNE